MSVLLSVLSLHLSVRELLLRVGRGRAERTNNATLRPRRAVVRTRPALHYNKHLRYTSLLLLRRGKANIECSGESAILDYLQVHTFNSLL